MAYPSFLEHLRSRYGSNWCVAPRASRSTARYGAVITPKKYEAERDEWIDGHPAFLLANGLPSSPDKQLILDALRAAL